MRLSLRKVVQAVIGQAVIGPDYPTDPSGKQITCHNYHADGSALKYPAPDPHWLAHPCKCGCPRKDHFSNNGADIGKRAAWESSCDNNACYYRCLKYEPMGPTEARVHLVKRRLLRDWQNIEQNP